MAAKFKIATSQSKEALVLAIKESQKRQIALTSMESRSLNQGTYRKDKNTVPRIINLLLRYPDALARSSVLASRIDLQDREVGPNRPIWLRVCQEFNDVSVNSGGLMQRHEVFLEKNIDPEVIHGEGVMTPAHANKLFKDVQRRYAEILPR
jgi:hypothetical protein